MAGQRRVFSGNVLHPEDADLDGDRFGFWQAKWDLSRLRALHQVTRAQAKTSSNSVGFSAVRNFIKAHPGFSLQEAELSQDTAGEIGIVVRRSLGPLAV